MANSVWVTLAPFAGPAANNISAPPYSFAGDQTTGYASGAVGQLDLVTGGVSRVSVSNTGVTVGPTFSGLSYVIATLGLFPGTGNRAGFLSPADGQMNVVTSGLTTGAGFDVSTQSVLKVRTVAQTGYATVDALGYKVSGTAGVASFGPAGVVSITVVNGLITAIS